MTEKKDLTTLEKQAITLIRDVLAHGAGKVEILVENPKRVKMRKVLFIDGATD